MKKRISLSVDDEVWREFRKSCIDRGESASQALEDLMKKRIGKRKG